MVGLPRGPRTVHVDLTHGCNARCVSCWDHSPLLHEPRPAAWKARRMAERDFATLVADLEGLGATRAVLLTGMGEPFTHPGVYRMGAAVKARGWHLSFLTNLMAADLDRLEALAPDRLLVGIHGASPDTWAAFHPGWDPDDFHDLCLRLRRVHALGIATRHVQVLTRETVGEVPEMVAFGALFGAERVNFKLASLRGGTERCRATPAQLRWLRDEGIPEARRQAAARGVETSLDHLARQVTAALGDPAATAPPDAPCVMGHVYCRVTAEREVLFCCNTEVRVGRLGEGTTLGDLWRGTTWQRLRDEVAAGRRWPGCETCGKLAENLKWHRRLQGAAPGVGR